MFNDNGVEIVIQTDDGAFNYGPPKDKKGAYVEVLNMLLDVGVNFYVIPGLEVKKVAI